MTKKERHRKMIDELVAKLERVVLYDSNGQWPLRQARRMYHTLEVYGQLMPSQLLMYREWMNSDNPGGSPGDGYTSRPNKFYRQFLRCESKPKGKRP